MHKLKDLLQCCTSRKLTLFDNLYAKNIIYFMQGFYVINGFSTLINIIFLRQNVRKQPDHFFQYTNNFLVHFDIKTVQTVASINNIAV